MSRLLLLLHTRLALRTTAIIVLIVALLGGLFLGVTVHLRAANVHATQQVRLQELITTVERTAQIACFLGDERMADEVSQGLLSNNIVNAVTIRASDGKVLATGRTGPAFSDTTIPPVVRDVTSPFEPDQTVCRVTVEPDQEEVDLMVAQASTFIGTALVLQLLGIGVCVTVVVARYVTRPITELSHRLSELEAETGQKLQAPPGNLDDEIGTLVASVNVMIDNLVESLGQERRLRLEREVEERRYRAIFDNVEAGLFELDGEGLMRSANPAFRRLFGIDPDRNLDAEPIAFTTLAPSYATPGRIVDSGSQLRNHAERDAPDEREKYAERADDGERPDDGQREGNRGRKENVVREEGSDQKWSGDRKESGDREGSGEREAQREYLCEVTHDGTPRWISLLVSPLETGRLQGVAHDVTARKRAAETAAQMAMTDSLTGLGNRRGFEHRLAVMSRHHRLYPDRRHTLLMLDFDHFKQINDTYGHQAGDRVLLHAATTLSSLLRQRDYIARLGGDEFVVLLEGCDRREEVVTLVQRFLHHLATPVALSEGEATRVRLGVSIGIATLGVDTEDPQQAVEFADRAMYAAKRAGRNTWRFYTAEFETI